MWQACKKGLCGAALVLSGALGGRASADDGVWWVGCVRDNDDGTVTGHVWVPPSAAGVMSGVVGGGTDRRQGSRPDAPFWFSPDGCAVGSSPSAATTVFDPDIWDERLLMDDVLLGGAPAGSAYVVYRHGGERYARGPIRLKRGASCRGFLAVLASLDAPRDDQLECVDDECCLVGARVTFFGLGDDPRPAPRLGPDVTDVVRMFCGPDAACWSEGDPRSWPACSAVLDFYSAFCVGTGGGGRRAHSELHRPDMRARVVCEFADGSTRALS